MANKKDVPVIFGADIGNGYSKTVSIREGEKPKIITFQSVMKLITDDDLELPRDQLFIDGSKRYCVGAAAAEMNPEEVSIDSHYIKSEQYRRQLFHALALHKIQDVDMITGLPVEKFKDNLNLLKEAATAWRKRAKKRVKISNVTSVLQPLGTYYDICFDFEYNMIDDRFNSRVGLIDIGYGTIDAIQFYKGEFKPGTNKGLSNGVFLMYDKVNQFARDSKVNDLSIYQTRDIIEKKFIKVSGVKKDASRIINLEKNALLKRVQKVMKMAWPNGIESLDYFVFTGGGADLLKAELAKIVPETQLVMPINATVSNACGYAKFLMLRRLVE